jgi:hypothetical protein
MTDLIPAGATEKHIAFLGATGSGKTSAAKRGLVEPALAAGRRVCILDPTGAWWGLRLKADGTGKGYPIYIFGGDHGDYPLRARDAALLAETFATASDSAIFDMSLMTVSERTAFFTEFAETIRRKNKGPLHLVIDEAHLFMPQAGAASGGAVPAMLHAANNLVSLGRSRGLRIALISQRPAKVHKDSLTQVQSLVAMRLLAPQDRKAIADWIADQADPEKGREIIASLPSLKPGEAWVWSPQDDVLRHTKFPLPRTFDSSKAPDITDGKGPELAPVNLDALKGRLTALEAEAKANDPKALKAEIMRLRADLARPAPVPAPMAEAERQAIRDHAYQKGISAGRAHIAGLIGETARTIEAALANLTSEAGRLTDKAFDDAIAMEPKPVNVIVPSRRVIDAKSGQDITHAPHVRRVHREQNGSQAALPRGERACLIAAAQHPKGVTRQQLTVLTGYKRSSRDTYIQRLRERCYIDAVGDRIVATHEGKHALGDDFEPLPTGAELREYVLRNLPEGERKILECLISVYPSEAERNWLDGRTGYKRSSRDTYLQRLSARELIETVSGMPRASATLFD